MSLLHHQKFRILGDQSKDNMDQRFSWLLISPNFSNSPKDIVLKISRNVAATFVVLHMKFHHLIQIKEPSTGYTLLKRGFVCPLPGLCSNHISSGVPVIYIPQIFFMGGEEKALGRHCWTSCEKYLFLNQHSPCIKYQLQKLHHAIHGFL